MDIPRILKRNGCEHGAFRLVEIAFGECFQEAVSVRNHTHLQHSHCYL